MTISDESHWFQALTACAFLAVAYRGFTAGRLPKTLRVLWLVAGCLAAADEKWMMHECLKVTLLRGTHGPGLRDWTVLAYGLGAALAAGVSFPYFRPGRARGWGLCLLSASLALILLTDVFGVSLGGWESEVEEISEAVAAVAVAALFTPKTMSAWQRCGAAAVVLAVTAVLSACFLALRPVTCAAL